MKKVHALETVAAQGALVAQAWRRVGRDQRRGAPEAAVWQVMAGDSERSWSAGLARVAAGAVGAGVGAVGQVVEEGCRCALHCAAETADRVGAVAAGKGAYFETFEGAGTGEVDGVGVLGGGGVDGVAA